MATFQALNYKNIYYKDYLFYKATGPLTDEDVQSINRVQRKIIIVFDNTKGQHPDIVRKIHNPNVKISVLSGLDYLHKKKFQSDDYVDRTIYQPNELASIIEFFQKLEKGIRYTWTPRQKAMYVYKTLAEYLHYKEDFEQSWVNGKDVTRSLTGLLYGRLYCAGFALVFKEAMDRLGIPCHYQNVQYIHSFNILELDGKYYGVDLTWDCSGKKRNNNRCSFVNFGLNPKFYEHFAHKLDTEPEETKFPLSTFKREEIAIDDSEISSQNIHERRYMTPVSDSSNTIFHSMIKQENGFYHYLIVLQGQSYVIHSKKKPRELISMDVFDALQNNGWDPSIPEKERVSTVIEYRREDGTMFVLTKSQKEVKDIGEYYYFDVVNHNGKPAVRRGALLSEMDLSYDWKEPTKSAIANRLLSKERVSRKIKTTRGYVGYLGGHNMYYDRDFERDNLQILDHVSKS